MSASNISSPPIIDFTARWCLTCKTVEYRVYNDQEVADRTATLESRTGKIGALPLTDIIERFAGEIASKA